ncbi:hypothetical protein Tco_0999483 [Tanacetum coccineum]
MSILITQMEKRRGYNNVSLFVRRANNLRYTIMKAEYSMLELDDIEFLYLKQIDKTEWKEALKEFMKEKDLVMRVEYFQLGIESYRVIYDNDKSEKRFMAMEEVMKFSTVTLERDPKYQASTHENAYIRERDICREKVEPMRRV